MKKCLKLTQLFQVPINFICITSTQVFVEISESPQEIYENTGRTIR